MKTPTRLLLVAAMLMMLSAIGAAQIGPNPITSNVTLTATMNEQFSFVVTGSNITWTNLLPGQTNAGGNTVSVTTRYLLDHTRTAVDVSAYFDTNNALTDGAGNNIDTTLVSLLLDGAATGSAFVGNSAAISHNDLATSKKYNTWGAGLQEFHTIGLNIDLTSLPQLPAGTYNGTMHLRAQVI